MERGISGIEDKIEEMNNLAKEDVKLKKKNLGTKRPGNLFNKIIEEKLSNLKKEMPIKVQEETEHQLDWNREESTQDI